MDDEQGISLRLKPATYRHDGRDVVRYVVDGLPAELFAQIIQSPAAWRTQWGVWGERLASLPLFATPQLALVALLAEVRKNGYSL